MEGYGTFNYGIGVNELSRDKELIKRFGPAADLLSSVMYRLALNDESHMQERLTILNPSITFERYSYQEKVTIARCIFVILNYFDNEHISKQLISFNVSRTDIKSNLKTWEKQFSPSIS